MTPRRPVRVYADGGLVFANPSPWGGAWAYRHVDVFDLPVAYGSGLVLVGVPGGVLGRISNNQVEYLALLEGIAALPDRWSGEICSDSEVALAAILQDTARTWLPAAWQDRAKRTRARLGFLEAVHMAGHPTQQDLRRGRRHGHLCSVHQQWCDLECRRVVQEYRTTHRLSSRVARAALGARKVSGR